MMNPLLDMLPLGELAMASFNQRFVHSPAGHYYVQGMEAIKLSQPEADQMKAKMRAALEGLDFPRDRLGPVKNMLMYMGMMPFLIAGSLFFSLSMSGALLLLSVPFLLHFGTGLEKLWRAWRGVIAEVDAQLQHRVRLDAKPILPFVRRNPWRAALPWVVVVIAGLAVGEHVPALIWPGDRLAMEQAEISGIFVDMLLGLILFFTILMAIIHDKAAEARERRRR